MINAVKLFAFLAFALSFVMDILKDKENAWKSLCSLSIGWLSLAILFMTKVITK